MHDFTLTILLLCQLFVHLLLCIHPRVLALWYMKTRVYFHTGRMNHLAENLSLISHLRFLFTLAGAPFSPLSLILRSSQPSARSRSHLRWAAQQGDRSQPRHNSSPSPVFMDCEIDLGQGQQRFGVSATRATLLMLRWGRVELWVALVSGSVTPHNGTGIHWNAKIA